ncbi:jouberin-like [Lutzomyia longipalpis]|uniref:jouberin-like n=1 Tax=Lutzomyia longipalpis TaxID=7200 RepID=UPI002484224C|nr:jouberin-like [Lutzomyia longipalpis]
MEVVVIEDKAPEKPSVQPRRRAFMDGSTSSNISADVPIVHVEMADIHSRRPIPMPRRGAAAVQEVKVEQEIVDVTSLESDDTGKEIFFAESRKNTIIQPDVEYPHTKLERIASESSTKHDTPRNEEMSNRESSSNPPSTISSSTYARDDGESDALQEVSEAAAAPSLPSVAASESSTTKKRKKRTKKRDRYTELEDQSSSPLKKGFSYEYIVGIYLHHIAKLKIPKQFKSSQGPRIRISWYDVDSEQLLKKSDPNRNVSLHGEHMDYIQPLLSRESRIQNGPRTKYICCEWEELLIFNEDIERMKSGRVVVFFELLCVTQGGLEGISWAFLKPYLEDTFSNIDKRSELQLFEYYKSRKEVFGIFEQWKKPRRKFPATIVITLKGVRPLPIDPEDSLRPMNVLQKERLVEFTEAPDGSEDVPTTDPVAEVKESRKKFPGQQSKCPNQLAKKLKGGPKGSFVARFHPDGTLLIYSAVDCQRADLIVTSIPNLETLSCLEGHTGTVYDLDFYSRRDRNNNQDPFPVVFASASADRTVAIWNVKQDGYSSKALPHPSFVYCCRFIRVDGGKEIILSGGRDCVIRLWDFESPDECSYFDELTNHEGFVTCLCVGKGGGIFFSGDSEGTVFEWHWKKDSFDAVRSLTISSVDQEMIYGLSLHTRGEKILVGTSANTIYCVDMKSRVVLRSYQNSNLHESRSAFRFILTPCGNLLFGCSDQVIACWNTVTGDHVDIDFDLPALPSDCFISSLDFCMNDSLLILAVYGSGGGVFAFDYAAKEESTKVPLRSRFRQLGTDLRRKIEVKNKLTEIIRKIDDVFVIPKNIARLSDDDKLLERKLTRNREEITEWLNNVATHSMKLPSSISHSSTYTIHRDSDESSDESGATFTVDAPPPKPPRSKIPIRCKDKPKGDKMNKEANLTYEIAPKSEPESDDTTISEELQ